MKFILIDICCTLLLFYIIYCIILTLLFSLVLCDYWCSFCICYEAIDVLLLFYILLFMNIHWWCISLHCRYCILYFIWWFCCDGGNAVTECSGRWLMHCDIPFWYLWYSGDLMMQVYSDDRLWYHLLHSVDEHFYLPVDYGIVHWWYWYHFAKCILLTDIHSVILYWYCIFNDNVIVHSYELKLYYWYLKMMVLILLIFPHVTVFSVMFCTILCIDWYYLWKWYSILIFYLLLSSVTMVLLAIDIFSNVLLMMMKYWYYCDWD